jgi:hypothetical protein
MALPTLFNQCGRSRYPRNDIARIIEKSADQGPVLMSKARDEDAEMPSRKWLPSERHGRPLRLWERLAVAARLRKTRGAPPAPQRADHHQFAGTAAASPGVHATELQQAQRLFSEAGAKVDRQRQLVLELRRKGAAIEAAEARLRTLRGALMEHRKSLLVCRIRQRQARRGVSSSISGALGSN